MRTLGILLVVVVFSVAGCGDSKKEAADPGSTQGSPAVIVAGKTPAVQPKSAALPEDLITQIEKHNGYFQIDQSDPEALILIVQFRYPGPSDDDLQQLRPELKKSTMPVSLNLGSNDAITDAGIAALKDLPTLLGLELTDSRITDNGLEHLAGLTNLESLHLSGDRLTDSGLVHVGKLKNLRQLSVFGKKVTSAAYAHLEGLTALEKVHVGTYGVGDEGLRHMKGMTRLDELYLGGDTLTDAGMAHVKNFAEARKLQIYDARNVSKAGLASLAALHKLETLAVYSCPAINGDGMAPLKGLTNLRDLELGFCGTINTTATANLAGLTNLKYLRFDAVEDDALQPIKGLTSLETVDLSATTVSDTGLSHLRGLTGLRGLNLTKTRITDAGMPHLGGMTGLEKLSLADNKLTDDGLKHLIGLKKLQNLWLSGNPITDTGLTHLRGLSGLENLDLTGTKTSDKAALALKQALPKTRMLDYGGVEVYLVEAGTIPFKIPGLDFSKTPPAFSLTADQFLAEYQKDRDAAGEKFRDKVVELTGVVKMLGRDKSDAAFLILETVANPLGVVCITADAEPWSKVGPGQKVKVKGIYPESALSAALVDCVIAGAGPNPTIVLSAEQLAGEYAADRQAVKKKYDERFLLVTGEIVDKSYNSSGATRVVLKGDGKVRVSCQFSATENALTRSMQPGQSLRVLGQYTLNFDPDEVGLFYCLPLSKK